MTVTPFAPMSAAEKPMEADETPADPDADSTTHGNVESNKEAFGHQAPPNPWQQNVRCDSTPLVESGNKENTYLTAEEIMVEMKAILGFDIDMRRAEACVKKHTQGNEGVKQKKQEWLEAALNDYLNELSYVESNVDNLAVATCANRPAGTHARVTQTATDVVDLTKDDSNDLQIAIAQSIADKAINKEDQDMNKAIEESLKANQGIPGFAPFGQKDPENPHERSRAGVSAVGLKNVGNTCWFNVIAQALFNVPRIRQVLLDYSNDPCDATGEGIEVAGVTNMDETEPSQSDEVIASGNQEVVTPPVDSQESNQVRLARALRRLFALLLGSKRKYIDPSEVLDLIARLNAELNASPSVGIQQDVTEMLLRLIEWLEQAFGVGGSGGNAGMGSRQPRGEQSTSGEGKDILNEGKEMQIEGKEMLSEPDDHSLVRTQSPTPASQAPELAAGDIVPSPPSSSSPSISADNAGSQSFKHIFHGSHIEERVSADGRISTSTVDQSLHITNLHVEYETFHDSLAASQWQEATPDNPACEQWFVHVPPVIVFSLRRFSFDKSDLRTVKLHKEFSFPVEFFIDRYLHHNRDVVADKRLLVKKWRDQLERVLTILKQYDEFALGNEKRVAVSEALSACIRFMGTANNAAPPVDEKSGDEPMDTSTNEMEVVAQSSPVSAPVFNRAAVPPAELAVLDRLLNSALRQATEETEGLRQQATELRRAIDLAFDEVHLLEHPYRLHAVLIHEGEANVGHYWAYIADHATVTDAGIPVAWRKYNDKTVEPATWEQVTADSYGTRRNCSAYCLVYVHKNRRDLFENDTASLCSTVEEATHSLPRDLAELVEQDNAQFVAEVKAWDEKEERRRMTAEQEGRKGATVSWAVRTETVDIPKEFSSAIVDLHSELACKHLGDDALAHALKSFDSATLTGPGSYEAVVVKAADWISTKIDEVSQFGGKSGIVDPRLMNILVWLTSAAKTLPPVVRQVFLLESLPSKSSSHEFNTALGIMLEKLRQRMDTDSNDVDKYKEAHVFYYKFLQSICLMHEVMCQSEKRSVDEKQIVKLLKYLIRVECINEQLNSYSGWAQKHQMVPCVVENAMRILLLRLTEVFVQYVKASPCKFGAKETEMMKSVVLPLLIRLGQRKSAADVLVLEHIHSAWQMAVGQHDSNNGGNIKDALEALQMILDANERQTTTPLPFINIKINPRPSALAKEAKALVEKAASCGLLDQDPQAQTKLVAQEIHTLKSLPA